MHQYIEISALSSPEALEAFVTKLFKPFPYKTHENVIKWDNKHIGNCWVLYYSSMLNLYLDLKKLDSILNYQTSASYRVLWQAHRVKKHIRKFLRRLHSIGLVKPETYIVYKDLGEPVEPMYKIFNRSVSLHEDGQWRI